MKRIIAILLLALSGCATVSVDSDNLARVQTAVSFASVDSPDMTGYLKHWTVEPRSAWYKQSTASVLVLYSRSKEAIRITGFPKDLGQIVATGWEKDERFFVHVSLGADAGTMIYCDLAKREVTEVKRWGDW